MAQRCNPGRVRLLLVPMIGLGLLIAFYRFRTESYDNMGPVGEDPRWEAFGAFHEYLLGAFPLVCVSRPVPLATCAQSSQVLNVICHQGQHLGIGVCLGRLEPLVKATSAHRSSRCVPCPSSRRGT